MAISFPRVTARRTVYSNLICLKPSKALTGKIKNVETSLNFCFLKAQNYITAFVMVGKVDLTIFSRGTV